jgi:hypothetical protein
MYEAAIPLTKVMINAFHNSFDSAANRLFILSGVIEAIGKGIYAPEIEHVRQVLQRHGKSAYDCAKTQLPAYTFCGTFWPTRGIANLRQHSGIAHGDLDDLPDAKAIKHALASNPCTVYAFVSPSGTGLKVGVHITVVASDRDYKHAWQVVATEYEQLYGIRWNPSGKDISRLCFVSHDPDLYTNFNAEVFDVPPAPAPDPRPQPQRSSVSPPHTNHQDYAERAIRTATEMIQQAPLGVRHHTRLRAARLLGGYVAGEMISEERAYGALAQALVGYTEHLEKALKTVEDGLRYGQEHPIKIEDLETERQAWLDQHRSWPRVSHQKRPTDDPWAGRRTLPLRPYGGLRMPREVRRG